MKTIETGGPAFPQPDMYEGLDCVLQGAPGMSLRQCAAIHLRVPSSGDDWLDDMITEARMMDATERAMQGLIVGVDRPNIDDIAGAACRMAEATLEALRAEGIVP